MRAIVLVVLLLSACASKFSGTCALKPIASANGMAFVQAYCEADK